MTSFDKWAFSKRWLFLSRFEAMFVFGVFLCDLTKVQFIPVSLWMICGIVLLSDMLKREAKQ